MTDATIRSHATHLTDLSPHQTLSLLDFPPPTVMAKIKMPRNIFSEAFIVIRWDDYRLVNKLTVNALGRPLFRTLEMLTLEISAKNIKVIKVMILWDLRKLYINHLRK